MMTDGGNPKLPSIFLCRYSIVSQGVQETCAIQGAAQGGKPVRLAAFRRNQAGFTLSMSSGDYTGTRKMACSFPRDSILTLLEQEFTALP